jgi:hypothetical protein
MGGARRTREGAGSSVTPTRRHGRTSIALVVAGCLFTTLACLSLWSWRSFATSTGFADVTTDMLKEPAVREVVADQILNALEQQSHTADVVVAARPVLEDLVAEVVATEAFRDIFHAGVRELHSAVIQGHRSRMGVDVDEAGPLVADSVVVVNPELASALPEDLVNAFVGVTQSTPADRVMLTAELAGWLALPFALLACGCFVAAVRSSATPRRTTEVIGWSLVGLGAVAFLILATAVNVFAALGETDRERTALRAVFWSLTHLLNLEAKALITIGAVLTVAAMYSGTGRIRQRADDALHLARVRLKQPTWRAGACFALIAAGLVATVWPTVTAELIVRLLAFVAFVFGAAGLLDLVGSYQWGTIVNPRTRAAARRAAFGGITVACCLIGVLLIGGLALIGALQAPSLDRADIDEVGCNGHIELCDVAVNDVAFFGAHNAMAGSREDGWFFRNQIGGLNSQLNGGVRAFMLDLHYGVRTGNGVRTVFRNSEEESAAIEAAGQVADPTDQDEFDDAVDLIGQGVPAGEPEVYLCHVACELGATRAEEAFRTIDDYLRSHPTEVVILILEDHVAPEDAVRALDRAGLDENAYTWEPDPDSDSNSNSDWPTLREMINSGNNVLVLVENEGGATDAPAWYHDAYDGELLQDTPYRFETISDFSCELERGSPDAPLFLINHWVSVAPPSPVVAERVNRRSVLDGRVAECDGGRGRPNIIAVDFFDRGDVRAYVDELNGVTG